MYLEYIVLLIFFFSGFAFLVRCKCASSQLLPLITLHQNRPFWERYSGYSLNSSVIARINITHLLYVSERVSISLFLICNCESDAFVHLSWTVRTLHGSALLLLEARSSRNRENEMEWFQSKEAIRVLRYGRFRCTYSINRGIFSRFYWITFAFHILHFVLHPS